MPGFFAYLKANRYPIIITIIGFVIGTVIVNTGLSVVQEFLKRVVLPDETRATIRRVDSSIGAFPEQSLTVYQLLSYELSASDLIKSIKLTAVFGKKTEVVFHNVIYSIDVEGFDTKLTQNHYLEIALRHSLDVKRKARFYFLTRREISSLDDAKPEQPDISVDATDKKGNQVHSSGVN